MAVIQPKLGSKITDTLDKGENALDLRLGPGEVLK